VVDNASAAGRDWRSGLAALLWLNVQSRATASFPQKILRHVDAVLLGRLECPDTLEICSPTGGSPVYFWILALALRRTCCCWISSAIWVAQQNLWNFYRPFVAWDGARRWLAGQR
jgi:hypothetical protein